MNNETALSISADSRRKLSATWEKISNRGRLLSCLAKCYYVGNLPNSTGQAGYFSIYGLLLLNLLKGLRDGKIILKCNTISRKENTSAIIFLMMIQIRDIFIN